MSLRLPMSQLILHGGAAGLLQRARASATSDA